jgi:type IV pilus assembly protein PilE
MFIKIKRSNAGFSLVELMVVVAIIGILAGLALPKFNLFQAKARQSEVKSNLSHIYTLQVSYFGDNDTYVEFGAVSSSACNTGNALGFVPSPCNKLRYTYNSNGTTSFTATGNVLMTKIFPACGNATAADTWTIDSAKNLRTTSDGLKNCTN